MSEIAIKEAGMRDRVSFMVEYLTSLCEALGFDPQCLPWPVDEQFLAISISSK